MAYGKPSCPSWILEYLNTFGKLSRDTIPQLFWGKMRICGSFFLILQANYEYIITHIRLFVWVAYLCNWHCIIYMRIVGKGNPFDAYGHEVAPRTKHLMISGPYSLCRNPMLEGIYIYDAGVLVWLWSVHLQTSKSQQRGGRRMAGQGRNVVWRSFVCMGIRQHGQRCFVDSRDWG